MNPVKYRPSQALESRKHYANNRIKRDLKNKAWKIAHPNTTCCICGKAIYRTPSTKNGHNACTYACRNKYYSGTRSFALKHGLNIGGSFRVPLRDREREKSRRERYKLDAIALAGGACSLCGYNKCVASLQFRHRYPATKDKSIKDMIAGSWARIAAEIKKCTLLCANCHGEVHYTHSKERRNHERKEYATFVENVHRAI